MHIPLSLTDELARENSVKPESPFPAEFRTSLLAQKTAILENPRHIPNFQLFNVLLFYLELGLSGVTTGPRHL